MRNQELGERLPSFEEEERAVIELRRDDWDGLPDPFTTCMARLDELNGDRSEGAAMTELLDAARRFAFASPTLADLRDAQLALRACIANSTVTDRKARR
jgi:hypothetical protein